MAAFNKATATAVSTNINIEAQVRQLHSTAALAVDIRGMCARPDGPRPSRGAEPEVIYYWHIYVPAIERRGV